MFATVVPLRLVHLAAFLSLHAASTRAANTNSSEAGLTAPSVTLSPTSGPAGGATDVRPPGGLRTFPNLLVSTDVGLPFGDFERAPPRPTAHLPAWAILYQGGAATSSFECADVSNMSSHALERSNVAARRIDLKWVVESDILNEISDFMGSGSGKPDAGVTVSNARVQILGSEAVPGDDLNGFSRAPLDVALDPPEPILQVAEENMQWFQVVYGCFRDGTAVVELRFEVGVPGTQGGEVCLRWRKECTVGWRDLNLKQGEELVLADGVVQGAWKQRMEQEGTHNPTTNFQLSANGVTRLKRPYAYSNQKLLSKVDVRGLIFDDVFEITREPVSLTLVYSCEYDGFADVTLVFEKETLQYGHVPDRLELKLRKHCGFSEYKYLQVLLRSEAWKNKTEVVRGGQILPGFLMPCQVNTHQVGHDAACSKQGPLLEVPPQDLRTSFELIVSKEGSMDPPQYQPVPDLSYNRKVLSVSITMPHNTNPKQRSSATRPRSMIVKYTCYREGTSLVMVTLYVLAHKPIDIVWRKRCEEPKAHVGKALTAPQAIVITLLVCALIAVVVCIIFMCVKDEEEDPIPPRPFRSKYVAAGLDDDGDVGDVELPPQKLGVSEVVHH